MSCGLIRKEIILCYFLSYYKIKIYLSGVICWFDWAETVLPALPAADGTIVGKACAVTMELVEL